MTSTIRAAVQTAAQKAEQATQAYVRCAVSWSWPGASRAIKGELKDQLADKIEADARSVSAGTALYDWNNPALSDIRAFKREVTAYWQEHTVRWPAEDGVRLLQKRDVEAFEAKMAEHKACLAELAKAVQAERQSILNEARRRRGKAFNEADYPADLSDLFALSWRYDTLTVPEELEHICQGAYAAQVARHQASMIAAVQVAEEGFLTELADMVCSLQEKLEGYGQKAEPGKRGPSITTAAVENLQAFVERFSAVVCWGTDEIDEVFLEAGEVIAGVEADDLRRSRANRQRVAAGLGRIAERLALMLPKPAAD